MSNYNFRMYREPTLPEQYKKIISVKKLDCIEKSIVSVLQLSAQTLLDMGSENWDHGDVSLKIRRMYDGEDKPEPISAEWDTVRIKAKLTYSEIVLAMKMKLTPKHVLGMVSNEVWKDLPGLHLRRMYDERHVHPALMQYWINKEGPDTSPYTKTYIKSLFRKRNNSS